jgi:CPA1 family monovalent cation:H+ antiporter
MSAIGEIELVFLFLLVFIIAFGLLSKKIGIPYPIVMVVGGLLLSLIPGIPHINLDPDLIFLIVLPPLLYGAAWTTSWRDFRSNLISILFLAFGLVGFTVLGVSLAAPHVFSGFDWRLGFMLGAVVAPTDAIAATAIAKRVRLPHRIVDVLEGESLVNDASGLLALQFATTIVVQGEVPGLSSAVLEFVWLVAGGIGLGLLTGWIVDWAERQIDDAPIEITLSILVPYAVYLAAERIHASGILAVVSCGLLLARGSARFFSPAVRIQIWSVWQSLTFILNGLVFVLIGLQLHTIRASIREMSSRNLIIDGLIFSALLILLRLIWVFPGARVAVLLQNRWLRHQQALPAARQVFVVGWTGMRGVISLAAALALPTVLADGSPLPHRDFMVFLTFCVILVTLVVQGLTLPPLIRVLGLAGAPGLDREEQEARRHITEAALAYLEEARKKGGEDSEALYEDLIQHYSHRLASFESDGEEMAAGGEYRRFAELSLEALHVERATAIHLRDEGNINDNVLRRLERELDLNESRIRENY